jgi:hypothetical protein
MVERLSPRLTYANVVATLALFVALGGGAYAAFRLPKNSVGTKQIKNGAVTNKKLGKNAVTGAKVAAGSLTGTQINASTLGTVPRATHASSADNATHATSADTASTLVAPEAFHEVGATGEPAFHTPWSNFGSSLTTAGFYKDQLGIVHLKGAVHGTTTGIIFTLPSSDAPARDVFQAVGRDAGEALLEICGTLELDACGTGGEVRVDTSNGGISDNVYLDGVTFRAGE